VPIAFAALVLALAAPATAARPLVAIFYYPWYGTPQVDGAWEHWSQNGHAPPADLYSSFYPAGGPYSSSDPAVVAAQMAQIRGAGIDEVVTSWWGRGSSTDVRLPLVLREAWRHHLGVGVQVEPYPGRGDTLPGDLAYLRALGIRDVFVYRPEDLSAAQWSQRRAAFPSTMRYFAQTGFAGFAAAARFDGLYTYDPVTYGGDDFGRICAEARRVGVLCAPSVGPGFQARRAGEDTLAKPRRNGATYDSMWRAALAARPPIVTITSFNEWGEGTQIEPAVARRGYASYDGAWGMHGSRASGAYLARTAYWTARFHHG
jgi:glycoprotein endo-alpha-1,2-mannosidase